MRTITLLCTAALCTLPNVRNLNAHPFDPQDSPIVVADGTYPIIIQGKKAQTDKKQKQQDTVKTPASGYRTIYHKDGLPAVIQGIPGLYRAKDSAGQGAPVCLERSHPPCSGAACDAYYVDLYGKSWTLALNDVISLGWDSILLKTVLVNTSLNAVNTDDVTKIVDAHPFSSATLTVASESPQVFHVEEYGKFTIHFCHNNRNCMGDDKKDHCATHQ
jgi:hypothetical protein